MSHQERLKQKKEWAEIIAKLTEREKKEMLGAAGELISIGRGMVAKRSPWISTTLYGMIWRPVWEPNTTFGITPGLVCYFNPYWVMHEPAFQGDQKEVREKMAGCVFHEPWHPLHGFNRIKSLIDKGMSQLHLPFKLALMIANLADDISINETARKAGYEMPEWVVTADSFKPAIPTGLIMEENWAHLTKHIKDIQEQATAAGYLTPSDGGSDQESQDKGQGEGDWRPGPCSGACGGSSGNVDERTKEVEKKLDEQFGRHKADIDRIRKVTINEMKAHQERHGRGSVPGFREELFAFKKKKPLVRWESRFRHILRMSSGNIVPGDDDYSMLVPDRHSALLGICLPSLIEQEPEIAFIRDTSGSMGAEQINYTNNEIIHAMKALGVSSVWLIDADVETKGAPRRVRINDIAKIPVRGRGGTSFVQPLESVSKMRPKPDIVIYMTDGDGWAPEKKPRWFEVIWCVVPGSYRRKPANWGHIIVCSNDRNVREAYAKAG